MKKENFDTPEWRKYFEDKSSEEIEKIKKTFGEKIERKENTQKANRKETRKGILTFFAILIVLLCFAIWHIAREKTEEANKRSEWNKIIDEKIAQKEAIEKQRKEAKSQQLKGYSPLSPEKRKEDPSLTEWKRKKYGHFPPSDYEITKDLLRDQRLGKEVPLPSPERRKEIDKMIEDIFR